MPSQETSTEPESRNTGLLHEQEGSSVRPRRSELHCLSDEFQGSTKQLLDDDGDETGNKNDYTFDSV